MPDRSNAHDALRDLARRGETGCLDVRRAPLAGSIYLNNGTVVHVDLLGRSDPGALLEMLGWKDTILSWFQGATPYRHTCHIPPSEMVSLSARDGRDPGVDLRHAPRARDNAVTDRAGVSLPRRTHYDLVLQALEPAQRPREHLLHDPNRSVYIVGASPDCDIRIDHYSVCQRHASILIEDDLIRLWDLGSHDATHVNGDLVEEAILQTGDILQIGDIAFRVLFRARPTASESRPAHGQRAPRPTQPPLKPLRFEDIQAKERLSASGGKAIAKLFDTLRLGRPSKSRGRRLSA